jgi:hypothetical protein
MRFLNAALAVALVGHAVAGAQTPEVIYDEAKVPKYTLPDPLLLKDGERVRDVKTWTARRRPEILELYRTEVYGGVPTTPVKVRFEAGAADPHALDGKAVRKQVTAYFGPKQNGPKMDILIYLPPGATKPVPVFLALSFSGNQTITNDPGVKPGDDWVRDPITKTMVRRPAGRGASAQQWQLEKILAAGYALATIYYGDIEPDFDAGIPYGVRPLFFKPGQTAPAPGEWGAIGAWAWGLSRAMDYLETDRAIDAKHVALMGHSRLGKAALWAGAQDTRFSIVISNESGEGGAAISRRDFGERTKDLNTHFPWWFSGNFKKYDEHEDEMPFDSNFLLSLIAPRPLYVASAEGDRWSDPRGEFLGALNAGPVYELFGKQGLGTSQMPQVHEPVQHDVAYHIRAGKHDVTAYDWEQYLKFARMHWGQ